MYLSKDGKVKMDHSLNDEIDKIFSELLCAIFDFSLASTGILADKDVEKGDLHELDH